MNTYLATPTQSALILVSILLFSEIGLKHIASKLSFTHTLIWAPGERVVDKAWRKDK